MYRTADETPRCPCCHSLELSELTKFDPSEGFSRVHFALKEPGEGFFAERAARYTLDRARICLSCGHAMLFVSEKQRADLAGRIGQLAPVHE